MTQCAYSSLPPRQTLIDGLQSVCVRFLTKITLIDPAQGSSGFSMFVRKARTVKMSKKPPQKTSTIKTEA